MICQRLIDVQQLRSIDEQDDLLPSSVDVHGHDSFYEDEESDSGDLRYEHHRTGSEEIFDGKKKKHYSQYGDEENKEEVEEEDEGTEEDSTNTFKSKCKHYWSIISSWITKLILHWSKNSLLIDSLVYRTILILFVAYDMLCCLFYIIDYNNYIQNQFYVFNGLLMVADSIARYCFVNHSYHCLHDVFTFLPSFHSLDIRVRFITSLFWIDFLLSI